MNRNIKWVFIAVFSIVLLLFSLIYATFSYYRHTLINPSTLLNKIKTYFKDVNASYILEQPFYYIKDEHRYFVYQGGISTIHDDKIHHYEFIVNAYDGEIIDIS